MGLFLHYVIEFFQFLLVLKEFHLVLRNYCKVLALHSFQLCMLQPEWSSEFLFKQQERIQIILWQILQRINLFNLFHIQHSWLVLFLVCTCIPIVAHTHIQRQVMKRDVENWRALSIIFIVIIGDVHLFYFINLLQKVISWCHLDIHFSYSLKLHRGEFVILLCLANLSTCIVD